MPKQEYNPGETVTVGALEVGDLIFARRNRTTQAPSAPVRVERLQPSVKGSGLVLVVVQGLYTGGPWVMGWLPVARTFPRAVPVEG